MVSPRCDLCRQVIDFEEGRVVISLPDRMGGTMVCNECACAAVAMIVFTEIKCTRCHKFWVLHDGVRAPPCARCSGIPPTPNIDIN
jgi:hypothetical protein